MVIALDRYHYDFRVQGDMMMPVFQNTTELYKFKLVNGAIVFDARNRSGESLESVLYGCLWRRFQNRHHVR